MIPKIPNHNFLKMMLFYKKDKNQSIYLTRRTVQLQELRIGKRVCSLQGQGMQILQGMRNMLKAEFLLHAGARKSHSFS